jgi:hypothetical protein
MSPSERRNAAPDLCGERLFLAGNDSYPEERNEDT